MKLFGVDVNTTAFKSFKSLEALKKEPGEIFKHLGESDEDEAYKALWEQIAPPKKKEEDKD